MAGASPLYPTVLPTMGALRTVVDDVDDVIATDHNDLAQEIVALAAELGLLPKGSAASVRARLDESINDDGTLKPGALQTTVPTYPTSTGIPGQRASDADYVYICYDTDLWKRSAISTW